MILTITPNTGVDRILFLDSVRLGERNQAHRVAESVGCKGCDVSMFLRAFGEDTVATGLAAGATGRRLDGTLREAGVTPDFVWVPGETRWNTVLVEADGRHTTLCTETLQVGPDAVASLSLWIGRWAGAADAVVFGGSLPSIWPAETYTTLVAVAAAAGKPVLVDASGAQLRAALNGGSIHSIKPNRRELESLTGPLEGMPAVLAAAKRLRDGGVERVLVSMGDEGALLSSHAGAWFAEAVPVSVLSPAGAGDGMMACLALAAVRGWDEPETLRWAVATATAIVTNAGTSEVRREQIELHLPHVRVRAL